MKEVTMKKIFAMSLALLLILTGTLGVKETEVKAQDPQPINYARANFDTHWIYSLPGDNFINGEVTGNRFWSALLQNYPPDDTGQPVTNAKLTLDSVRTFTWFGSQPPEGMGPPTYMWEFGDIPEEPYQRTGRVGTEVGVVTFFPGFDLSREVEPIVLSGAGTSTPQTLIIRVIPRETMSLFSVVVTAPEDDKVNPLIISATADTYPAEEIYLSPDGRRLEIKEESPDVGEEYVYTVTLEVTPKVEKVFFKPPISVGTDAEDRLIARGVISDISVNRTITDVGTWTWSADGTYAWRWTDKIMKQVNLLPYSSLEPIITGKLIDAETGAPLSGADVRAVSLDTAGVVSPTKSAPDGSYRLSVPIGHYMVSAFATDYTRQFYNVKDFSAQADEVMLTVSGLNDINFNLTYGAGSVTGHVYEADGMTPVYRAFVEMYTYDGADWILAYRTLSQIDGSYSITSSMPGDYKVMALMNGYVYEWYQESTARTDAHLVTILSLTETPGIDFTLSRQYETPTGDNVIINDTYNDVTIEFTSVNQSGSTSVNVVEDDPSDGTSEFRVVGKYYDIVSYASYDGPITITIIYDDTDLSENQEKNLSIWHWDSTHWSKIDTVVDIESNTMTSIVDSLSWFAIGEPNESPVADAGGPYLTQVGSLITLDGTGSNDPDGIIATYEWDFGDGNTGDGVTPTNLYTAADIYYVNLTVTDDTGAESSDTTMVVVYDPDAGFATGGGWFIPGGPSSDLGDMLPGLDNTSPANFGFMIKYKHGATSPDGQLEFQYQQGDFNLHSSGVDWLIITNNNWAKFRGLATIKGLDGFFPFHVDARDGDNGGGDQADRFIIKIWAPGADPDNDELIYKASGDLEGGNVIIHSN
jgi:hypothetical protein